MALSSWRKQSCGSEGKPGWHITASTTRTLRDISQIMLNKDSLLVERISFQANNNYLLEAAHLVLRKHHPPISPCEIETVSLFHRRGSGAERVKKLAQDYRNNKWQRQDSIHTFHS